MSNEATVSFMRYAGRLANSIHAKLNGDAPEENLREVLRAIPGIVKKEDARVVARIRLELKSLVGRCGHYKRALDLEAAKWPEHLREAYQQELERRKT